MTEKLLKATVKPEQTTTILNEWLQMYLVQVYKPEILQEDWKQMF